MAMLFKYAILQVCYTSSSSCNGFYTKGVMIATGRLTRGFFFKLLQFSSVTQSCPTLCNPMDCSTPGQASLSITNSRSLFKLVHWVGDAIQLSHPLSLPSPPVFILSQHQGLFQGVSFLHQVTKVLELQLQHLSFQWIFRTDFIWCRFPDEKPPHQIEDVNYLIPWVHSPRPPGA